MWFWFHEQQVAKLQGMRAHAWEVNVCTTGSHCFWTFSLFWACISIKCFEFAQLWQLDDIYASSLCQLTNHQLRRRTLRCHRDGVQDLCTKALQSLFSLLELAPLFLTARSFVTHKIRIARSNIPKKNNDFSQSTLELQWFETGSLFSFYFFRQQLNSTVSPPTPSVHVINSLLPCCDLCTFDIHFTVFQFCYTDSWFAFLLVGNHRFQFPCVRLVR